MLRKSLIVVVVVVVCGCTIADGAAVASQPLLQPLTAQFHPAEAGYAAGYGYGGVQQVPAHYADAPTAVGYAPSAVYKPDLSTYAAASSSFSQVEHLRRFNPVLRPVHTVVPKVTAVEPSVAVHKTYVDVPVHHEYRPTVVVQDPSPYYNYYLVGDRK